ncbi:MAG: hypothetical protein ACK5LC_12975, partial [Coprobacillaceae bacterium]
MKKIIKKCLIAMLTLAVILPTGLMKVSADDTFFSPYFNIVRVDSDPSYGSSTHPSYVEGDTQYYRNGDLVALEVYLPANHSSVIDNLIIKFDSSKVKLLSSYSKINRSIGDDLADKDWSLSAMKWDNDSSQIFLSATASSTGDPSYNETDGGLLATIYFQVLDTNVETELGTAIDFEFEFQAIRAVEDQKAIYCHEGYDANNHDATRYMALTTETITAKKPTASFSAKDGFITKSEAKNLATLNDLKNYNDVTASVSDGSNLDVTVTCAEYNTIKAGTEGTYTVTYSYTFDGNTYPQEYKLTVIDDDVEISDDKTVALKASNIIINETAAKALGTKEELISLNQAQVYLSEGGTATPLVNAPGFADMQAGTVGTYDVTYSYGSDSKFVSKTVYVTVVKDGSDISDNNKVSLYAKDGFIIESEAKALTQCSQLAPYNSAEVTHANGDKEIPNVSLDSTPWNAIKLGTLGTYNIAYMYGSGDTEVIKNANLTIISDDSIISNDGKTSLVANDVDIYQEDAKKIVDENDVIDLAGAEVTLSDGSKVKPEVVIDNLDDLKAGVVGDYEITFKYGEGDSAVEKTITITVTEDLRHEITAKDVFINQSAVKQLASKDSLRTVNDVQVTAIDGTHPDAVVNTDQFGEIKAGNIGTYTIVYSYGTGTKEVFKSVTITVVKDGSETNEDASLFAKNAFLKASEAKGLSQVEDLISHNEAGVVLFDGTTATPAVSMLAADWALLNNGTKGTYAVIYTYSTLTKTVNVVVIDDDSDESEDGTVSLYAENGFLTVSQAKAITGKNDLRNYNKALVTLTDGTTVDATVSIDA